MISGPAESNPAISSIPGSSGSAIVNWLLASPQTISLAFHTPIAFRYSLRASAGWILPNHVSLSVNTINTSKCFFLFLAHTIGSAQSVPTHGNSIHDSLHGVQIHGGVDWVPGTSSCEKPTISWLGSVRAVTIVRPPAAASLGVSTLLPFTFPQPMEPLTSRARQNLWLSRFNEFESCVKCIIKGSDNFLARSPLQFSQVPTSLLVCL